MVLSSIYNVSIVLKGYSHDLTYTEPVLENVNDMFTPKVNVVAHSTRIVKLHGVEKALYRLNYSTPLKVRMLKAILSQQVAVRGGY